MKILKFWAPWCGNCAAFAPIVEEVANELGIQVISVDASKEWDLCETSKVVNLPTLIVKDDADKEVLRLTGLVSKKDLLDKIKNIM